MKELKGACIIGQSGGPTSVINASAYGVIDTALKSGVITQVLGAEHGIKGVLSDRLFDMGLEDPEELRLLKYTPSSALGSCRYKIADPEVDDTDYRRILEVFKKHNVRYFFYNGGNDSMDTCNKISKYMQKVGYPCRIMGIPKTIDNDLFGTDHCPGFGSAAKYIATSMMEVNLDAHVYDTGMIVVMEIMGRHAGYLALYVGVAVGATAVLVPEHPYDFKVQVADNIRHARLNGKTNFMIVVAEGAASAVEVGRQIQEELALDPRVTILGHIQRGGSPTAKDRVMATRMGYEAVRVLAEGKTNRVICAKDDQIIDLDIDEGLAMKKTLNSEEFKVMTVMTGM